jgi:hypothetical protein
VNDFPHLIEDLITFFVGFSVSLPLIIIDNQVLFNYQNEPTPLEQAVDILAFRKLKNKELSSITDLLVGP